MGDTVRERLERQVRTAFGAAIIGWMLFPLSMLLLSVPGDGHRHQLTRSGVVLASLGAALFVGAILKLTFYVKCAACSGRLGQFAMTTMGPFGRRMNYCPYCGISLDRAAPSPDGSDLK